MLLSVRWLPAVFSRPPHMHPAFLRRRHASLRPIADLLAFKLREHGELAVKHAADSGRGIDALGEGYKINVAFPQFAEDLE